VTQPVFDITLLETSCGGSNTAASRHRRHLALVSARNAEFMKNELRVSVPMRF